MAVFTEDNNVDPIGACIGQRGSRIQVIIGELSGEKIDIVEWSEDPLQFITNSLSPAKVKEVTLEEKDNEKKAAVIVEEDQLSLAIGKGGQNVRLAAHLTGWKINISEDGAEKKEESEPESEEKKSDEEGGEEATEEEVKDVAEAVEVEEEEVIEESVEEEVVEEEVVAEKEEKNEEPTEDKED